MFSGEDVYRPSYFEMIATDRLVSSLRPSFAHLCRVCARRGAWLAPLDTFSGEIFAALNLALEAHYLRRYDSSFAENFYGLKRMRVTLAPDSSSLTPQQLSHNLFGAEAIQEAARPQQDPVTGATRGSGYSSFFQPLSPRDRRRALFFLVALPYLRGRLEALYVRWRDQVDAEGFQQTHDPTQHSRAYNWVRAAVLKLYPLFHALVEASQFLGGVRFLFESSVFYSPWLSLASQVARRMNMDEMMAEPAVDAVVTTFEPGLVGALRRVLSTGGDWLTRYAKYGLLGAVCAFKFLEWWYSPANAYYSPNGAAVRKLPIPPPPLAPLPAPGVELPEDASLCPLCTHERVNPAAAPTGYVFCYACIHQHISAHHACPVTLKPCTVEQLRKIYEN